MTLIDEARRRAIRVMGRHARWLAAAIATAAITYFVERTLSSRVVESQGHNEPSTATPAPASGGTSNSATMPEPLRPSPAIDLSTPRKPIVRYAGLTILILEESNGVSQQEYVISDRMTTAFVDQKIRVDAYGGSNRHLIADALGEGRWQDVANRSDIRTNSIVYGRIRVLRSAEEADGGKWCTCEGRIGIYSLLDGQLVDSFDCGGRKGYSLTDWEDAGRRALRDCADHALDKLMPRAVSIARL